MKSYASNGGTNELQQRVETLERDLAEKEKKLFQLREEVALAKEEASQKTKLIVQLQREIVEAEKKLLKNPQSGPSLFGALLGAASAESLEITKLRKQLEVQEEELFSKIKENEKLQIRCVDLKQDVEDEKRKLSVVIDQEIKKGSRLQKELVRKSEELEVVKTQNDLLSKEMVENERKIEHMKIENENANKIIKKKTRESDRNLEKCRLLEQRPIPLSVLQFSKLQRLTADYIMRENEWYLHLSDLLFWAFQWRLDRNVASEYQVNAIKALGDEIKLLHGSLESVIFTDSIVSWKLVFGCLEKIGRACKTLSTSFEFCKVISSIFEENCEDLRLLRNDLEVFELIREVSKKLNNLPSIKLDSIAVLVLDSAKAVFEDLDKLASIIESSSKATIQVFGSIWETRQFLLSTDLFKDDTEHHVNENQVAKSHIELDSASQKTDDSLLISMEKLLRPSSNSPTLYNKPAKPIGAEGLPRGNLSSFEEPMSPVKSSPSVPPDVQSQDGAIIELKRHYHMQSMKYLEQVEALKISLENAHQIILSVENQNQDLVEERQVQAKATEEYRSAMRRAKEELSQTRASYDSQLQNFSERIFELDQVIKKKEEQIGQMKAEEMLMEQLKKTMFRKT